MGIGGAQVCDDCIPMLTTKLLGLMKMHGSGAKGEVLPELMNSKNIPGRRKSNPLSYGLFGI